MLQHIRLPYSPLVREAQEQPRILSLLLDKTEERIYMVNTNFDLVYMNRMAAEELRSITGRTVHIGENILAALPPSMLDTYGVLYRQSLDQHHATIMSGRSITGDSKFINRHGEERWIKMRISPLQLPTGEVIAIAVMVRDITRRKMAETRRDEYFQHLQAIMETMLDVVIAVDELQTIVTFNKAAEKIFGYNAEDILGQSLSLLFPQNYIELVTNFSSTELHDQRGDSTSSKPLRVIGKRKNGSDFPLEANVSSSLQGGRFFLTIVARDVSERVAMEEKARMTNKALEQKVLDRTESLYETNMALHRLNEEKNEIINMVSHDLKNPIGTVRGLAEMLTIEFGENEHLNLIAHHIMRSSEQMFGLVSNLLNLNALESGSTTIRPVTLNVVPILEALRDMYAQNAVRKDIRIELILPQKVVNVFADEIAFHQVLDNLISNAVKYAPLGSTIRIHTFIVDARTLPNIEREIQQSGIPLHRTLTPNSIVIAVQDQGQGVAPQDMPFLFTKFRKLSAQPTGGETSSGLGLSIVQRLMERMNGRVWCDSDYGNGATFFAEFPIAAAPVARDYTLPKEVISKEVPAS